VKPQDVQIRRWTKADDLPAITQLLHRAYTSLAEQGFKYYATWQDDATTLKRLQTGTAFVACLDGRLIGTVTMYPPGKGGCSWYERLDVCSFGQFGVEPELQGEGIGNRLLEAIEDVARACGYPNIALDTAESAEHLTAWYRRKGYVQVDVVDWEITNYRSVIMNKVLEPHA
jgi:GNAT superfamily N-acetyltransferase